MAGIYVHIPFCASRCIYCGFYSSTLLRLQHDYASALISELRLRCDYLPESDPRVSTIYFGGGTPSQLDHEDLARIVSALPTNDVEEMTIECNPDDVTAEYAMSLRRLGFDRVSMGVQTFDDARLRFLHRRHSAAQVRQATENLRRAGFGNVSVDLIFGFPGQTVSEWQDDLRQAVELGVEHISAYSLMYEEGTPLFRMLERGEVEEVDEEVSREMYETLIDTLAMAGFEHYEISNFAKPGFRSRHNSSYWNNSAYLGLGAAAHSYNLETRQWNVANVVEYINKVKTGVVPAEKEELSIHEKFNDLVTTAMRTLEGIDIEEARDRFGEKFTSPLLVTAKRLAEDGLVVMSGNQIRLTRKGLFVSDEVMREMIVLAD